jgi:hypothetical protein
MAMIGFWQSWDDIEILIRHQDIADFLWMFLRLCNTSYQAMLSPTTHRCTTADIEAAFRLDVEGICAYIGHIFQQKNSRQTFMTRMGNDAQMLVDLVQGVHHLPLLPMP